MNPIDAKDPAQAAAAAVSLARSAAPGDQEQLRLALGSSDFLLRLNSADDYGRLRSEDLRLAGILQALGTNSAPPAVETLAFLARNPVFVADEARQELLLRAAAHVRPMPGALASFLNEQTRPDAGNLHLAIDVLAANGSESAIAVLERVFASSDQEPENLAGWMRDPILRHRQDVPLLAACERLLKGNALPAELKPALVEALFDYHPEWYPPDSDRPQPPARSAATPEAAALLRRIGDWASHQPNVPQELRAKIQAELAKLK